MTEPVDIEYLNDLYAQGPDPWGLKSSFYERRKRKLLLGCLPRERYECAYEPGCAGGDLTVMLATRCDGLLASDYHPDAVRRTRQRVASHPNVSVTQALLPDQWPQQQRHFDLIVVSELGYYFTPAAWTEFGRLAVESAGPNLTLVACHWRHDFAERQQGTAELHARLAESIGFPPTIRLLDEDFVMELWTSDSQSPAQREGRR